jgi:hypothetical protein
MKSGRWVPLGGGSGSWLCVVPGRAGGALAGGVKQEGRQVWVQVGVEGAGARAEPPARLVAMCVRVCARPFVRARVRTLACGGAGPQGAAPDEF